VDITTIEVETIILPTMDVIKRGILIRSIKQLGSGLGGVSTRRKLNGSTTLLITTIGVVKTFRWCLPI
jgi:hypothetical protein